MRNGVYLTVSLFFKSLGQPQPVTLAEQAVPSRSAATPYNYLETPLGKKARVVITADPELGNNNSMIRYILMSDGYQVEGLIDASSQFH